MAANTISRNPIIFKVFLEEVIEFCLHHLILSFEAMFMLVPLLEYQSKEKQDSKKYLVGFVGPNGFKVILIQLPELVAI